jgi:hypothetical protein
MSNITVSDDVDDFMTAADKQAARTALQAVGSDPTGVTGATVIMNVISLTQAEYDAIVTPDPETLYIIKDAV